MKMLSEMVECASIGQLCQIRNRSPTMLSPCHLEPTTLGFVCSRYPLICVCCRHQDDLLGISGTILLQCLTCSPITKSNTADIMAQYHIGSKCDI